MSRMIRSNHEGVWFHATNHAIGSKDLFVTDIDCASFLEYLSEATNDRFVPVAYCLMGNHFHLVVRAADQRHLSAAMQTLGSRYARAHNRRNRTDGPVFRSRFYSKPIDDDAQLLVATRYVHRNPLELGLHIGSYPWSSYPCYLGEADNRLVDAQLVLELCGGSQSYRSFVESEHPADEFHLRDGVFASPAPVGQLSPLEELVESARALTGADARTIRNALLIVALDHGLATSDEIADTLALRSAAVVRALASKARVRVASDAALASCVARLSAASRTAA